MPKSINGAMFTKMVINASRLLDANRAIIDSLNVFPVPDGDTGTNMSLTMQSAVKEVKSSQSNRLSDISDRISNGALRGARGNSGVITSQVFKGICVVVRDEEEITMKTFSRALKNATDVAYSAVSKPKEGTMLTVCRMMSEYAQTIKAKDFESYFELLIARGEEALKLTPELLPVLKKAGVVDSGGMGLITIFKGMYAALKGEEIASLEHEDGESSENKIDIPTQTVQADMLNLGSIEFGYCTEFFITNLKKRTTIADVDKLRETLMSIGDSVLVIGDLEFVKVHVHTNNPGLALSSALELGEIDKVKIENMLEQNRELVRKYEAERKPIGLIAVAQGEGISALFKEMQVDKVIEGGQTMNPSANDIADAISQVNAEAVFVFPNNKNIILAAEQSKSLVEGRKIIVVPTKNIPQGFAAALAYDSDLSADENLMNMLHAIDTVTDGMVTYAVRTTKVDDLSLKKGDIIGLDSKKIISKSSSIRETTLSLIDNLKDKNHSQINLYYGEEVTADDAEALCAEISDVYPDCDVELYYGGQAVYYYILSLE